VANRYWVGGTASWDGTIGLKWALTSGGVGGQLAPTTADIVFFDANSGAGTVTLGISPTVNFLTFAGFTGTFAFGTNNITISATAANQFVGSTTMTVTGTPVINISTTTGSIGINAVTVTEANSISFNITGTNTSASLAVSGSVKNLNFGTATGALAIAGRTIYGNLTLSSTMSLTAGTNVTTFGATSGTQSITSNAKTIDNPVTINGVGGTVQLVDALTLGSSRQLTLTNGTFNSNDKSVTVGAFNYSNSNTKALNLGTSTITILSGTNTSGFLGSNAGTTYTSIANSTIVFTTTATSTFSGGSGAGTGNQFGTVTMSGLGGTLYLGSNTATTVARCTTLNNTVSPCTITNACTTGFTVTNFNLSGTAGNLVTFNSNTVGTARTISQATGTVNALYFNVKDSTATGGAKWYANSSNDLGNNTGWNIFNNSFLAVF